MADETAAGAGPPIDYRFRDRIDRGDWIVSVEVDPPRAMDLERGVAIVERLRAAGVDCIDAGDSPMAAVRMNPVMFSVAVQQRTGVEAIIHFTSRDRNLMALQADLMGAHVMGIRTLIALSGDPPSLGQYSAATAVWDVRAEGLIELAAGLNAGRDSAGNDVGACTDFTIVTSANPNADDLDAELAKMRGRAERGAHAFFTQNCFDAAQTERFLDKVAVLGKPVVLGVMPLASLRNARFMATQVPGVIVPDAVLSRMEAAGDGAAEEGLNIAREYIETVRAGCHGVYLVPALNRFAPITQLVAELQGRG
jgi:5,10-methylenetetrahydrofolate reductase